MSNHLLVLAGPDEGRVFPLSTQPLLFGRSRATEGRLIDPHVAQVHCQVFWLDDRYVIRDFDSEAGTFLNGERVSECALKAGDMIRIGNTRLQLVDGAPAAAEARPDNDNAAAKSQGPAVTNQESTKDLTGQKFGNFQIGTMFAKSKTGRVFHARHIRKNLDVALKILDPSYSRSATMVQRFNRAMKAVLPLRHPNLVKVFGAGKTGPHCWVAMEYVRADSLAAMIARIETVGMLDWRNVLRIQIYVTRALAYAHQHKLIHWCVTPTNVLVGKDLARTKLADLMLDRAIERDPTLPAANGESSADLPYMSPERTDGPGKHIDARTDIYSLGATMYALLTGQPPFEGKTPAELVAKIRLQAPPSMKLLHFGLPELFEATMMRMLAKRPEDRHQSAKELLTELERFGGTHNVVC
jgi:serine/threonine protein kinase